MSMTNICSRSIGERIVPMTHITGETVDISEFLDFGFYDRVWYKENAGLGPESPGRWLGVSRRTGRLMCYFILTQTGRIVSRTIVQRVTNLDIQVKSNKKMFQEFDNEIKRQLKD